jgi:NAD(P)-dependent dehydrogenase (short-subunit alcohol dehydrogenase family)
MTDEIYEEGRVVVVTGASAGLGRAIVREFARQQANIGLLSRNVAAMQAAQKEIEALGGRALVLPTDMADWEQVSRAADAVEAAFGPIDVWVNNAMTGVLAPFKNTTPSEFRRVTEVTYLGAVYGTKAALNHMLPRNRGSIVFVSSAEAYRGLPLQSAYSGAKHAIMGFYDSLRSELSHDRSDIKTSMVQLPGMNTTQFRLMRSKMARKSRPLGPIYQPEVAARAVVRAADTNEREYYVGRSTWQRILSAKLWPGLLDRYLGKSGYEGQLTSEPRDHDTNNLWEPVAQDPGVHGDFGPVAKDRAATLTATTYRTIVTGLVFGAVAALSAVVTAKLLDDGESAAD